MVMDKLREDFKEDYKFIDWFKSLSVSLINFLAIYLIYFLFLVLL